MNLITRVSAPNGIASTLLNAQLSNKATLDYRNLGIRENNAVKKRSKKGKK